MSEYYCPDYELKRACSLKYPLLDARFTNSPGREICLSYGLCKATDGLCSGYKRIAKALKRTTDSLDGVTVAMEEFIKRG